MFFLERHCIFRLDLMRSSRLYKDFLELSIPVPGGGWVRPGALHRGDLQFTQPVSPRNPSALHPAPAPMPRSTAFQRQPGTVRRIQGMPPTEFGQGPHFIPDRRGKVTSMDPTFFWADKQCGGAPAHGRARFVMMSSNPFKKTRPPWAIGGPSCPTFGGGHLIEQQGRLMWIERQFYEVLATPTIYTVPQF